MIFLTVLLTLIIAISWVGAGFAVADRVADRTGSVFISGVVFLTWIIGIPMALVAQFAEYFQ